MSMIDPFSPAFEDYSYDPHPGSPGDLYDPLPDVFDPNDWKTPVDHGPDDRLTAFIKQLRERRADRLTAFVKHLAAQEPPDGSIVMRYTAADIARLAERFTTGSAG